MKSQLSFAASEYAGKKKATRRERFLGEMEKVVPWGKLIELIGPYYPKGERGRPTRTPSDLPLSPSIPSLFQSPSPAPSPPSQHSHPRPLCSANGYGGVSTSLQSSCSPPESPLHNPLPSAQKPRFIPNLCDFVPNIASLYKASSPLLDMFTPNSKML